jgi:hypothetical protein
MAVQFLLIQVSSTQYKFTFVSSVPLWFLSAPQMSEPIVRLPDFKEAILKQCQIVDPAAHLQFAIASQ